ncbi:thiamine-phosphate kinase [Tessaracoccus oleiagri]|uniref:Thiamine-monophosphate kinase n=1 Tax=Tessaracoccus oleiagri TaxID=686624 RepID=A0A1G9L6H8_9ACTN|nr:thiamine-phosphate kinase [Tessaracoccus oleiagri]SDL57589.1 thiamine-monophosphate kinase [Tessaracoccus oleiagri]
MTGEFELIREITADLPTGPGVVLGVGDDAAALRFAGDAVVSTDLMVENVHFKRVWSSARDIGRKAVAINVSDIESMGATPTAVVVALAVPKDTDPRWIRELSDGVREECERAGVSLVGGDMSRSATVTVCVTALGDLGDRPPVTRSGARPGDVVAVTGRLGWAGAGLAALSRGFRSPKDVVAEAQCPTVPYGEGVVANDAGATAMMDVSDGLVQDLGHIARASGVAVELDSSRLEVAEPMERVGAATGKDPVGFVLGGGEDHALVATFPSAADVPAGWRVVGAVSEGEGVTVDGEVPEFTGWDHFA